MTLFSFVRSTSPHPILRPYGSVTALDSPQNLLHFLQLSTHHPSLKLIRQSHARILTLGLGQNSFWATKLVSVYAGCGNPNESRLVFSSVQDKNVYLWNSLINGYVKNHAFNEAFHLFNDMCSGNVLPDDYTLATLSKVCGELGDCNAGRLIHGRNVRLGFVLDTVVANSLMSMYYKCGQFKETQKLFHEMPERSSGSWNVLIGACTNLGDGKFDLNLLKIVRCMQIDGVRPDAFTVSSLLPLCGNGTGDQDYGRELHCYIIRNELDSGLGSDVHLGCCLIDMYCKGNKIVLGRRVFDGMRYRNVYAWTAMINGYVKNGDMDDALALFYKMQVRDEIEPNKVSIVSVLPACSSRAGLMGGKQIHGFSIRKELNCDTSLCNALIDMYSKCGSLNCARRLFEGNSFCKDAISWSSMISGYGLHGKGKEAIVLYDQMLQFGNKPDMITVVGVLSACGRSGLVNEGLEIYKSVVDKYGFKPTVEICSCVVDILGRAGQLDRALDFIRTMTVEPGPTVWGALVTASIMHGNCEMQNLAYKFLIQVEPANPSNYVSLSNLHASSRKWDVVAGVRTLMKERGLRKVAGCSWICISGETHCFYVADKAHPDSNSIYELLNDLMVIMKAASFALDFDV